MDYNPLKGMLVLILSLKLSIVPYAAGPESRGNSKTASVNISMSNCFPSFIVRWILNFVEQPTHKNHSVHTIFKSKEYLLHIFESEEYNLFSVHFCTRVYRGVGIQVIFNILSKNI